MATLSAKVSVARPCVRVPGLRRANASVRRSVAVVARAQGEDAAFVDASRMLMAAAAAAAVAMPGARPLLPPRQRGACAHLVCPSRSLRSAPAPQLPRGR